MATGMYVLHDGTVMVAFGARHIQISRAQYRANGYRPALEKLLTKPPAIGKSRDRREFGPRDQQLTRASPASNCSRESLCPRRRTMPGTGALRPMMRLEGQRRARPGRIRREKGPRQQGA